LRPPQVEAEKRQRKEGSHRRQAIKLLEREEREKNYMGVAAVTHLWSKGKGGGRMKTILEKTCRLTEQRGKLNSRKAAYFHVIVIQTR